MLVVKKEFESLEMVKEGDKLKDLELYAPKAMFRLEGTVRRKTKTYHSN